MYISGMKDLRVIDISASKIRFFIASVLSSCVKLPVSGSLLSTTANCLYSCWTRLPSPVLLLSILRLDFGFFLFFFLFSDISRPKADIGSKLEKILSLSSAIKGDVNTYVFTGTIEHRFAALLSNQSARSMSVIL